jgi:uridine phosphorylase
MCGLGDIEKYVLLPGDPNRVPRIASFFDEARKVSDYRGFVTYSGKIDAIGVSACSTGIGCPSTAIVVEELTKLGAKTLIRVGTTGSLQPDINMGDIVIATAAVRADGASKAFMPVEYPAVASFDVTSALIQAAKKSKRKVHTGIVLSSDAFYCDDSEANRRFSAGNVLSVEMECSTIFTLASMKRVWAGGILAVDCNISEGIKKGEFEPGQECGELDKRVQKAIDDEIKIAIEAVRLLERYSLT